MKVMIYTLGCKVNQYESQALERELVRRGHALAKDGESADACIVNTCSVTAVSDQKSRQAVRRLRREHPGALIAVCGCFVQTHPEDARALGADLMAGTGERGKFIDRLERAMAERQRLEFVDDAMHRREFEILPAGGLASRTRAMLKVEDGCVNFCSYCIIPYARGPVRSESMADAAAQAKRLAAEGYQEIVLTGIEISSWGRDLKTGQTLIDLMEAICAAAPGVRIRLGSLEPRTVTEDFCRRASALPNLCPQFHLSLQSGCDETLRRMNRRYGTARYAESVALLNAHFRRPAVTTDLIVGFPGETEAEFSQTLDFIQACRFARIHVFPYSVRPGTPAAKLEQVEKRIKEDRARRAGEAAAELQRAYLTGCAGETYPVLFEQRRGGRFSGRAPNYMEVLSEGSGLHNQIRSVTVTGVDGDALTGIIQGEEAI